MNFFDFAFVELVSAFFGFPERIQTFNRRLDRKVVFWNRTVRAPLERPCIPWVARRISRSVTEAPVNIVNQQNEADGKTDRADRSK
ncbi:hypothetical protein D3C73_1554900 [compost metagenome]